MSRLTHNLNSAYIEAMNRLGSKHGRKRIVAYVESYDDVFFWRALLQPLETDGVFFEVMLPSQTSLGKGKKVALANELGNRLGRCMIACVDADYDYLMQGATPTSEVVCGSPYVLHTYVYAIENYFCYAPALQQVCVGATLNDRRIFDFEGFLAAWSETVWPLFVWNIWCYRFNHYKQFSMVDFARIVRPDDVSLFHPEQAIEKVRHQVNAKVSRLQKQFPEGRKTYKPLMEELKALGLTPQTTYLYIRGHDLMEGVAGPLLEKVCELLRREREREIQRLAEHPTQMQNELAGYRHATAPVAEMLRKHLAYTDCPRYRQVQQAARKLTEALANAASAQTAQQGTEVGGKEAHGNGQQDDAKELAQEVDG